MIDQTVKQKEIFKSCEGDSWFNRNSELNIQDRIDHDLILKELDRLKLDADTCLEIGCAEGWRLDEINKRYNWTCFGIDPSSKAILSGSTSYENINLKQATADLLPYSDKSMSVIIIGFCLYLCDRDELFKISCEVDRVLEDGGVIVILDFYSESPYRNKYVHKDNIFSYKMDYSKLFTWNPIYQVVSKVISSHSYEKIVVNKDERIAICSLRKSLLDSYSETPSFIHD
jgi:ubiquinone/menaquinone biosynthesis C-methylase UbiE